jgi:hypothetical protein
MALYKRRLFCSKAESSYGQTASTAGADFLVTLADASITPLSAETVTRDILDPSFGSTLSPLIAQRKMEATIPIELTGSGTAGTAPKFSHLLLGSGMNLATVAATSNTYNLVTGEGLGSSELMFWADNQRHQGLGARGGFEMTFTAGEVPRIAFNRTAIYVEPTNVSNPTPTVSNQATPVIADAANTTAATIGGDAVCAQSLTVTLAPTLFFRDYLGCVKEVQITNHVVSGSITIVRPADLATFNPYALCTNGTRRAITLTHGSTAGNRVIPTIPYAVFGPPTEVDLGGTWGLELPFMGMNSAIGATDSMTLAFT